MGRRSAGARTASPPRAAAPPRHATPAAAPPARTAPPPPPPPAPAAAAPPPAPAASGGGMMSGLMGSVATGMAMGTGMSMANRAVDAVMGPRSMEVKHVNEEQSNAPAGGAAPPPPNEKCGDERAWLKQCMEKDGDQRQCDYLADLLKQCQMK